MGDDAATFLDVARSITGRRWASRAADPATVRRLQATQGLSEPLARALVSRGVTEATAADYLRPTLRATFPDPSSFADMDRAAALMLDALEQGRSMTVFADYDVDGACSASLLVRWFRAMGVELPIYVPDRLTEGYGPSPQAFATLKATGVDLIVTVDCGAAAQDALTWAHQNGLGVIVVDHHLMRETPPPAAALVNPNRADCPSGQGHLAAAGVTFVLLAALNREARRRGLFATQEQPDLKAWLDLAALGAICDVTSLQGFNRTLAYAGLEVMGQWRNPGMDALRDVAGVAPGKAGVFEAGFVLGPRVNAGGRIGRSDLGARLLSTDDPAEAAAIARRLDQLNSERKAIEAEIVAGAVEAVERETNFDPSAEVLVVARDGWHPGVIGIVASRLRERYRKPTIVIGLDRAADIGKGSGRSQAGVNLGRAVQSAFDAGLLLAGGGHAMAAGLTVRPAQIPELRAFLCEQIRAHQDQTPVEDRLDIDALAPVGPAALALLDEFAVMEPFGPGNPEPVFAAADVRIERPTPMRNGHLRCELAGLTGGRLKAIAWRAADTDLGRRLMLAGTTVHVAGRLKRDSWNGRNGVQFEVEDLAEAGTR